MERDGTDRAEFLFKVKEHADNSPFIVFEPFRDELAITRGGYLSLELHPEVSPDQAQALAELLMESVKYVRFTRLGR